jgi:ABC-2 type transport system permease protein
MNAFIYGIALQWKLDLRNKDVLLIYYLVPLLFFAFMGGIFTSIDPLAKNMLIQSMTIFGVTMGAILGAPTPLIELYGTEIKKAYKLGGLPLWVGAVNNFISAFIHLFIMSLLIFVIAPITFHAKVPENIVLYFISLLLLIITNLFVATVLGLVIKRTSKLTMISQLIFLPSIMLSGIMFPSELLPDVLQQIGKVFPATWVYIIMGKDLITSTNLLPLLIIITLSICMIIWCIVKLRVEE